MFTKKKILLTASMINFAYVGLQEEAGSTKYTEVTLDINRSGIQSEKNVIWSIFG